MKRLNALLLSLLLALALAACGGEEAAGTPLPTDLPTQLPIETEEIRLPDREGAYYDLEGVVLYLDAYGALPDNFITKAEARALGWEGGSVEQVKEGAAIGGDTFGNREGLLPEEDTYRECDLNTLGRSGRGAERLVFSDDGDYYYTEDHYASFTQVWVEQGEVVIP